MYLLILPFTLVSLLTTPLSTTALEPSSNPPPPLQTLPLYHLPSTPSLTPPSSKKPLATLSYSPLHPHLSRLTSITPPKNSTSLVQIGFCFPSTSSSGKETEECRTTAAYAYSFHPPYTGRFTILLSSNPNPASNHGHENEDDEEKEKEQEQKTEIISVSWRSWKATPEDNRGELKEKEREKRHQPGGRGDFDIKLANQVPGVWVDRVVGAKGRGAGGGSGAGQKNDKDGGEGEEEIDERTFLQKYWWVILAVTVFAMAGGGADK